MSAVLDCNSYILLSSLEEELILLFSILVTLHPKFSVQVWFLHACMTTWAMKTSMVRAQNHVPERDVREVGLFGLKQESICGNLRRVLKHWKDPHSCGLQEFEKLPRNRGDSGRPQKYKWLSCDKRLDYSASVPLLLGTRWKGTS